MKHRLPLGMNLNPYRLALIALLFFVWGTLLGAYEIVRLTGFETNILVGLGILLALHTNPFVWLGYLLSSTLYFAFAHVFDVPYDPIFTPLLITTATLMQTFRETPVVQALRRRQWRHPRLIAFLRSTTVCLEGQVDEGVEVRSYIFSSDNPKTSVCAIAYQLHRDDEHVGTVVLHTPAPSIEVLALEKVARKQNVPVVVRPLTNRHAFRAVAPQLVHRLAREVPALDANAPDR